MAQIQTTSPDFFKSGEGDVSAVVGYETNSGSNRVARYKFTAPPDGASHIALMVPYADPGDSQVHKDAPIRFEITQEATHDNANSEIGYSYLGTLTFEPYDGDYKATGEADCMLMPGEEYYLYMFPGSTRYGWWRWSQLGITLTVSGAAGITHIDTGSALIRAIPYIDTGSGWVQAIPYIDDGSKFHVCG